MPFDWQAELDSTGSPSIPALAVMAPPLPPKPVSKLSFAQAVSASTTISTSDDLPTPLIRGESVSIQISEQVYDKGMSVCKRNLRGRLVLSKGDKPYTAKDIQLKLQKQWKTKGIWSMTPLGRGYYEFFFSSEDDMRMVWAMGTVNLKPGVLRLFEWTKDFNMHKQRNTHAQVWIRLLELPQEYWMDRTLREIASAVGTPLLLDNATIKRTFGHYARILVDMDFSRKIFHEITVEREGYAFNVEVAYEWLPDFCTHCQIIGHDVSACRWLYPRLEKNAHREKIVQGKKSVTTKKQNWVPTTDNPSGIGSSTAFAAPKNTTAPIVTQTQQQKETLEEPVQHLTLEAQNIVQQQHELLEEPVQQPTESNDAPVLNEPVQIIVQQHQHSTVNNERTMEGYIEHDLNDTTAAISSSPTAIQQQHTIVNNEKTIEESIEQDLNGTTAATPPSPTATVVGNIDASEISFSMPLFNVIHNVASSAFVVTNEPILTQVAPLDVNSIRADPEATVDPTLQKNLNFMQTWLSKAAVNEEVPFTTVLTKSQKKKMDKSKASYQTRSQGPLPHSQ